MVSMWGMHQDPLTWGPDPEVFRPERWLEHSKLPWSFIPFTAGPRQCPAREMVTVQTAYVLIRFAQIYERVEARDDRPWTESRRIGFGSKYGAMVGLFPAKQER